MYDEYKKIVPSLSFVQLGISTFVYNKEFSSKISANSMSLWVNPFDCDKDTERDIIFDTGLNSNSSNEQVAKDWNKTFKRGIP